MGSYAYAHLQVQSLARLTALLTFGTTACLAASAIVVAKLVATKLPFADYDAFRFADAQQTYAAGMVALMSVFFAFGGQVRSKLAVCLRLLHGTTISC